MLPPWQLEREYGLVVIKERWPPFIAVVAGCTVVAACAKLVGVRISVTFVASLGCALELDVEHIQFHIWWLVAICTGHGAMRAH